MNDRQDLAPKFKMFSCDMCGAISPNQELAIHHMQFKHADFIEISEQWTFCAFCLTHYPTGHRDTHKCPSESGQCPLCSKKFIRRNKMWFGHMRTEHLEKIMVRLATLFVLDLYFYVFEYNLLIL